MDSFDFDNVKVEKANAMRMYLRLRRFANFVRVLEVCVALILLSWSSTQLPIAVKISGKYLREISVVLLSTPFIFVIGNVIIITLVAQSGKFPGQNPKENNAGNDLYDEFVRNSESRQRMVADGDSPVPEGTLHQDKQIVCSKNAVPPMHEHTVTTVTEKDLETKWYRRTQSESFQRETREKPRKELRRSVTEKCRKTTTRGNEPARLSDAVDDLNNEDFRRTIEAFIEKQQSFLKKENMAIVLSNQN